MTQIHRLFIVLVATATLNVTLQGQELNPTVTVNMDPLSLDQRQDVMMMAETVKQYLLNNRYTNADWEGERIPVDVSIWLSSRNGNKYTARISVVSKRLVGNVTGSGSGLLRVFDQDWSFEWGFNPTLVYAPLRYDGFTSVIDFYMLIAIGLDMDTYEDLGGTEMYKAAQTIAQAGNAQGVSQFSTTFQPGQFTRMSLITELMDVRYQGLRRLIFDYQDAIELFAKDPDKGRAQIEAVVHDIAEFKRSKISNRSVLLQTFFDAKSLELADIFKGYKGTQIWSDLRFLDPGNTQQYEAARTGQ